MVIQKKNDKKLCLEGTLVKLLPFMLVCRMFQSVPPQVSVAEGLKLASGLSHKVHAEGLPGYPSSPKKGRLTVIWNQKICFIILYLHLSCIHIYIYHTTKGFTAWILESDYLQAESSLAGLHVQPPCETDLLIYDI